jgi:hypothetical protein
MAASTAPRGKMPTSVAIQLPEIEPVLKGVDCNSQFQSLDAADQQTICNLVSRTENNMRALVTAIYGYGERLVNQRKVIQRQLDAAKEAAALQEAATGRVSPKLQSRIDTMESMLKTKDQEMIQLRNQLDDYKKLPPILGEYNEYFEKLIKAINNAQVEQPAPPQQPPQEAPQEPPQEPPQNIAVNEVAEMEVAENVQVQPQAFQPQAQLQVPPQTKPKEQSRTKAVVKTIPARETKPRVEELKEKREKAIATRRTQGPVTSVPIVPTEDDVAKIVKAKNILFNLYEEYIKLKIEDQQTINTLVKEFENSYNNLSENVKPTVKNYYEDLLKKLKRVLQDELRKYEENKRKIDEQD